MTDPTISQDPADDQEPVHISQVMRDMLATYDLAVTEYRNGDLKACILFELGYHRGIPMGEHLTAQRAEGEADRFLRELADDGFAVPELPAINDDPLPPYQTGDAA